MERVKEEGGKEDYLRDRYESQCEGETRTVAEVAAGRSTRCWPSVACDKVTITDPGYWADDGGEQSSAALGVPFLVAGGVCCLITSPPPPR